jgi:ADP-L-glycero-D-manno-heptose 6-epimerase
MLRPRYVVTGAAGFIGSRLLQSLAVALPASELLAVDHPVPPQKQVNLAVAPSVPFMGHQDFLHALESGELAPEVIFHMGACSATTETNWSYLEENNLRYSQRIWTWCARQKSRVIYASSAATYGDGSEGFDDERPIDRLRPLNLYGKSKHDFDLWVDAQLSAGHPAPRQSVGLKFFNVYGPGEGHKGRMASMVFHGWNQIRNSGQVKLFKSHREGFTDGGQLRDFIYVGDVVDVMESLRTHPEVSGLFNLGTGQAHSFRALIEALFDSMERRVQIEYIPMPEDLRDRYQYFTEATMRKLSHAGLVYKPTPMAAAVAKYVLWLESHAAV